MQKVFVIFLLSLSTCLSKPSDPKDAAPLPDGTQKVNVTTPAASAKVPEQTPQVVEPLVKPTVNTPQNPSVTNITVLPNVHDNATQTVHDNVTQTVPTNATKVDGDNKTTDKKEEVAPKTDTKKDGSPKGTVIPAANELSPKSDASTQETKAKVEPSPPKNDVTPKPNATSTTVPPKADGEKPVLQARGFDGPSFIGGIILTLGILAIGFMGFKYYKNQTERNYHTL